MAGGLGRNVKQTLGKAAKNTLIRPDKHGKTLRNAYTGKKINPLITGGVGAGIIGGAVYYGANGHQFADKSGLGMLVGKPIVPPGTYGDVANMTADGLGGNPRVGQAPTLGTSGDMVFGMHNKKQGGYL